LCCDALALAAATSVVVAAAFGGGGDGCARGGREEEEKRRKQALSTYAALVASAGSHDGGVEITHLSKWGDVAVALSDLAAETPLLAGEAQLCGTGNIVPILDVCA
jgi:hypothetical protein